MKAIVCILALLLLPAGAMGIESNAGDVAWTPSAEQVAGDSRETIVVYVDEVFGPYYYVKDALDNLGLAYTIYYSDYNGFEANVASGVNDIILVSHHNYYQLSYAWDDILNELMAGKKAGLCSFDWDGSHDYSGYADDILAYAGHTHSVDWSMTQPIHAWPPESDPFWCDLPDVLQDLDIGYIDDGDELVGDASNSFAGTTTTFDPYHVVMNYQATQLVIGGWCPGQYIGTDCVTWWTNVIQWLLGEPTATEATSWGAVKILYQ
jgi:hypothetical protein